MLKSCNDFSTFKQKSQRSEKDASFASFVKSDFNYKYFNEYGILANIKVYNKAKLVNCVCLRVVYMFTD